MKKVYICSPYKGDVKNNTVIARRSCALAAFSGEIPICPHIYFPQFLDDDNPVERKKGIDATKELMKGCDEFRVIGDKVTDGMDEEINYALSLGMEITHMKAPESSIFRLFNEISEMKKEGTYETV
jgi:hypothetical protein